MILFLNFSCMSHKNKMLFLVDSLLIFRATKLAMVEGKQSSNLAERTITVN